MTFELENVQKEDGFSSDMDRANNILIAGQDDSSKTEKESRTETSKDSGYLISENSEPNKEFEEKTQQTNQIKSGK